jgi:hypothetical protein
MSKIKSIIERNARVEKDKAWETSKTRRAIIGTITYIFALMFLFMIKNENPWLNATIPVIGFLISTLTIPFVKKIWLKRFHEK